MHLLHRELDETETALALECMDTHGRITREQVRTTVTAPCHPVCTCLLVPCWEDAAVGSIYVTLQQQQQQQPPRRRQRVLLLVWCVTLLSICHVSYSTTSCCYLLTPHLPTCPPVQFVCIVATENACEPECDATMLRHAHAARPGWWTDAPHCVTDV